MSRRVTDAGAKLQQGVDLLSSAPRPAASPRGTFSDHDVGVSASDQPCLKDQMRVRDQRERRRTANSARYLTSRWYGLRRTSLVRFRTAGGLRPLMNVGCRWPGRAWGSTQGPNSKVHQASGEEQTSKGQGDQMTPSEGLRATEQGTSGTLSLAVMRWMEECEPREPANRLCSFDSPAPPGERRMLFGSYSGRHPVVALPGQSS